MGYRAIASDVWVESPPMRPSPKGAPQFMPGQWYYVVAFGRWSQEYPGIWLYGRQMCQQDLLWRYITACMSAEIQACGTYNAVPGAEPQNCSIEAASVYFSIYGDTEQSWLYVNVDGHSVGLNRKTSTVTGIDDVLFDSCVYCKDHPGQCPSGAEFDKTREQKKTEQSEWGHFWSFMWSHLTTPEYVVTCSRDWLDRCKAGTENWSHGSYEYEPGKSVPPPPIGRPTPTKEMLAQMAAERDKLKSLPKPSGGTAPDTSGPSKVPWAAIGIGAAAVGGLGLLWWAGRKS